VIIRQAMKGTSSVKGSKPFVPAGGMKPVLTVFIPACGMVLLTEVVGLYLAAMIYLLAYIKIVGGYRWRTVLLVSIPIPLIFYWVFEKIFLIPMPTGMFGRRSFDSERKSHPAMDILTNLLFGLKVAGEPYNLMVAAAGSSSASSSASCPASAGQRLRHSDPP
jgi:hypothetical protein